MPRTRNVKELQALAGKYSVDTTLVMELFLRTAQEMGVLDIVEKQMEAMHAVRAKMVPTSSDKGGKK